MQDEASNQKEEITQYFLFFYLFVFNKVYECLISLERMKKVVIIGGGFTGSFCAKMLESDFEVTLIDNKDYFEFTPGVLRTLVEPEHRFNIQAMHFSYLKRAKFLNERVVSVSPKEVKTNRRKLKFDYLVIASGSRYNSPIKASNVIQATRAEILAKYAREVEQAESIGIVGGGIVGVELAAEISTRYPAKEVSIITMKEIMERSNPGSREYARKFLEKHKVNLHENDGVKSVKGKMCLTNSGKKLKFDLIFLCTGITPNSEFIKIREALDDKKFIKVNDYLQLSGFQNIFVGGDIASIAEEKLAQTSEKHAKTIVENIYSSEKRDNLTVYKPQKRLMVISLGKTDGIIEYKNLVVTGIVGAIAKRIVEIKAMWKYR